MSYYAIGINKNNLIYIRERNVGPVACDFMGIDDDVVYDIMYNLITMTHGYVKLSKKYKNYNGITCAVCTAVKVSNKSYDIKKKKGHPR